VCSGTPGEDVQNKCGAVNNLDMEGFFQIPLLYWRKFIIKNEYAVADTIFQG